ncbi:MAG: hypothetical protein RJA55_1455 [Acidobacteriota bacterium]|jgi:hypothetical protein
MNTIRRLFIGAALALLCGIASAALTTAQLATLKADILADPTLAALAAAKSYGPIATAYNQPASPSYTLWRTNVTCQETTDAWVGTDIDVMSALNMQRLQMLLASGPVCNMSRADRRAWAENPFGTNVNNASRVAMRAIWKRLATRGEKLFASGTGSDASPAVPTFEGNVADGDVEAALKV